MEPLALLGGPRSFPYSPAPQPLIGDATVRALHAAAEAARTNWAYLSAIAGGGPVSQLENMIANYVGCRYVLAVSSGTTALFAALHACGVCSGDEVIVPGYTWGQTVAPILHLGATPVFADVDPVSYTMAPDAMERKITEKTRAIIAVHIYGHPADMAAIARICKSRRIRVIEDAAHALGASISGKPVGSWGDVSCFSLSRGKPLTGGEGGLICTNREGLFERVIALTQHTVRQKFELSGRMREQIGEFGYNFRIHPLAAVIATAEMDGFTERQRSRAQFYESLSRSIQDIPGIRPPKVATNCEHAYYRYCPTFVPEEVADGKLTRERYIQALSAEGVPISSDPIGIPLYNRKYSGSARQRKTRDCPETDKRCDAISLSLGSWLPDCRPDLEVMIHALRSALLKVSENTSSLIGADCGDSTMTLAHEQRAQ